MFAIDDLCSNMQGCKNVEHKYNTAKNTAHMEA